MNYTNWKNLPDRTTPLTAENLLNDINNLREETKALEASKIIESGSTENGEYTKYSNGKMVCLQTINGTINIDSAWGVLYHSIPTIKFPDFPKQFIDTPFIFYTYHGDEAMISPNGLASPTNPGEIVLVRPTVKTDAKYKIDILSIGKWK